MGQWLPICVSGVTVGFSIRSFGSFDGTRSFFFGMYGGAGVSVSALSDHLMGLRSRRNHIRDSGEVSVSALSDHLMGPGIFYSASALGCVSVSALSDHLMGHNPYPCDYVELDCFSIRSFGSFDGTAEIKNPCPFPICFSIRSFGSFDGTSGAAVHKFYEVEVSVSALSDHLMGPANVVLIAVTDFTFQYPLFRII